MKTCYLILSIFLYIVFLAYYFPNRDQIKSHISASFPKLFSTANSKIISVTNFKPKKNFSPNDEIQPLRNSEFQYFPEPFLIDDSSKLKSLNLACSPDSFGYSIERGNEVFPYRGYPKCSKKNNQNDTYLHIDRKNNKLYMNCPDDSNKKFVTGPFDNRKLVTKEEGYKSWEIEDYEGPVDASKIEFGVGSCEKDGEFMLQVDSSPIFNSQAYENASKVPIKKPKIIFYLTLDSVSRRHFFRKLPKVVDYLNKINANPDSKFVVFDYKLHNILGGDSPDNQVPIFGGKINPPKIIEGNLRRDFLGDLAIWKILRQKGYISVLGFEDCDDNFIKTLGRMPDVDYAIGPFYCAIEKFSSGSYGKGYDMQRCVGGHQSHFFILNHTNAVIDLNPNVNVLVYLHLNAAHDGTGLHAETLNDDIYEYLEGFLNKYGESHEVFMFLQADHGMRYGSWYKEIDAYQEKMLPSMFIISSKSLLDQYPRAYHSLYMNTERLVSKMDLRETALFIEDIKEETPFSVNLLDRIVPKSRTCVDAGIEPWLCSCLTLKEIVNPSEKIKFLVEKMKEYSETVINSLSYSDPKYPVGKICKKINLTKVSKIYQLAVNNVHEVYKLEIDSDTQKDMRFQITIFVASDGEQMGADRDKFILDNSAYGKFPIKFRILIISRLDSYAGPCEIQARNAGIRAEFCACQ